jgi:ATP-dependent protease ClpP protease subunit
MHKVDIRCQQTAEGVELAILGDVTSWVVADIMSAIKFYSGQKITLMLMSQGGDALASLGLHDFMQQHNVDVEIYGIAASGAAIISQAGRKVRIAENGMVMIHEAYRVDDSFNAVKDDTTKMLDDRQVEVFAKRTGKKRDKVRAWMAAETFFNAQDAVDNGFADEIIPAMKLAASLKTMKPMEQVTETVETVETETVEQAPIETPVTVEDTDEVEVEIPVSTGEAIKAAIAGKFKAKVRIGKEAGDILASMIAENKGLRAQLDEANAQVEALAPKAAEADAAVAAAADSAAKVEEVTAQVEALKATPIDAPIVPAAGAAAVVPGTATATARPVSERAQKMASTNDRMDRKFGFNKA